MQATENTSVQTLFLPLETHYAGHELAGIRRFLAGAVVYTRDSNCQFLMTLPKSYTAVRRFGLAALETWPYMQDGRTLRELVQPRHCLVYYYELK